MKHVIVFFLLVVMTFQWVGSLFTISLMDAIVVKTTMTARENVMAEYLSEQYDLSSDLTVSEVDPANYVRMGYGAPFIFSDDTEGELSYYSISNEDTKLLLELKELSIEELQHNANPHMVSSFFPIFVQIINPIEIESSFSGEHINNSGYSEFYQSLYPSIVLPPPNYIV